VNNNLWHKLFRERPFLDKSVVALQPASIKRGCQLLSCHTNMRNTTASPQVMMQKVIPLDLFKSAGTYFLNYWKQRNCLIRKGGGGDRESVNVCGKHANFRYNCLPSSVALQTEKYQHGRHAFSLADDSSFDGCILQPF
jgi:hypothetical protein